MNAHRQAQIADDEHGANRLYNFVFILEIAQSGRRVVHSAQSGNKRYFLHPAITTKRKILSQRGALAKRKKKILRAVGTRL